MDFKQRIVNLLSDIPDPEIPVISIVELGVIRDVKDLGNDAVEVIITPTYSGCPAMKQMEDDVVSKLKQNGFKTVNVKMVYSPCMDHRLVKPRSKTKIAKIRYRSTRGINHR